MSPCYVSFLFLKRVKVSSTYRKPNSRLIDVLHHPFLFKIAHENVPQNRAKWGDHCDAINLVIVLTIINKMTLFLLQTRVNSLGPIGVI